MFLDYAMSNSFMFTHKKSRCIAVLTCNALWPLTFWLFVVWFYLLWIITYIFNYQTISYSGNWMHWYCTIYNQVSFYALFSISKYSQYAFFKFTFMHYLYLVNLCISPLQLQNLHCFMCFVIFILLNFYMTWLDIFLILNILWHNIYICCCNYFI